VDGVDGGKLAGTPEELTCLPDGALARPSGGLLGLSSGCSGGRACGAEEQNRAWSGAGRREGKNRLGGAPLIAA
jgi:hypothetical protein